jgi:argininosuccinate lyase
MWKGRFEGQTADSTVRYTESISFDWRLYRQDIRGSIAHATMLAECGILSSGERDAIVSGLREIEAEISDGRFEFRMELEDIHMNIESELTRRIGPAGAKLHSGRSRNDQIATDLRLYLREEILVLRQELCALSRALAEKALAYAEDLMPGYTHLQRAQPVTIGHHLLAYTEMFDRDNGRLADCFRRTDVLPLGSSALASTTLPINREMTRELLKFSSISRNSMDAVSDRDFIVEFLSAASLTGLHLSRFCEDLVLWSSAEFGTCRLADAYCTGSSLMPQKRNPDVAELTRGKSARLVGNLVSLMVLLKAQPMTYNRDLQEDKVPLFDSVDTLHAALGIMTEAVRTLEFDVDRTAAAASDPAMLATDIAEMLVRSGVPFRRAHDVVGGWVGLAERKGKTLTDLTEEELSETAPEELSLLPEAFMRELSAEGAVERRTATGGPAPACVKSEAGRRLEEVSECMRELTDQLARISE